MSVVRSVREHFVAPARAIAGEHFVDGDEEPGACADPAPRTPPGVAVLSVAADARPLGAALGLELARRRRAPVVAVCIWTAGAPAVPVWRAPGLLAARRLAASLAARGHDARPAGRLALVLLPPRPDEAAAQARRVTAAAGSAPVVLALGGPRTAELDPLLAAQDLVVIAPPSGTEPVLARLALAGLRSPGAHTCTCEAPPALAARACAAAGLMLLPSMRGALAGALEVLR